MSEYKAPSCPMPTVTEQLLRARLPLEWKFQKVTAGTFVVLFLALLVVYYFDTGFLRGFMDLPIKQRIDVCTVAVSGVAIGFLIGRFSSARASEWEYRDVLKWEERNAKLLALHQQKEGNDESCK
ncbi:MAG: hypothetical protein AAB343_02435 [Patescibacteria group bacterium]